MDPTASRATIERLSVSDVPANVALSRSVGWKDVEGEWRVLHEAATVLGVRQQGGLLAQGALGHYGSCATLSKMVVASSVQRRGLGARLLDKLLAQADAAKLGVGLCATDLGRPLYESRQFQASGELVILTGTPRLGTVEGGLLVPLHDVESAIDFERRFMLCDRSRMLRARFRDASAKWRLAAGSGYGMASAHGEGTLVGPILAETEAGARALACGLLAGSAGPIRIDVPAERGDFQHWLRGLGLREQARRVEMARGSLRMPWQVAQRFALSTQAWG